MRDFSGGRMQAAWKLAAGLMIVRTTVLVVLNYPDYYPPHFGSDFLRGREHEFAGLYRVAFYTHIAAGPVALVLGMVLVCEGMRRRFPKTHRVLGRVQVAGVLGLVAPSGLWMAFFSRSGPAGCAGLAMLAVSTGACVGLGWRAAVRRRFAEHRRWMWRSFLLLGSAVVLRVLGGLASVTGADPAWADPAAIWASWLVPVGVFEWVERAGRRAGG